MIRAKFTQPERLISCLPTFRISYAWTLGSIRCALTRASRISCGI